MLVTWHRLLTRCIVLAIATKERWKCRVEGAIRGCEVVDIFATPIEVIQRSSDRILIVAIVALSSSWCGSGKHLTSGTVSIKSHPQIFTLYLGR